MGAGLRSIGLPRTIVWFDEALTFMHTSGTFASSDRDEYALITRCLKQPVDWKSLVDEYQFRKCPLSDVRLSLISRSAMHAPWFYEGLYLWNGIAKNDDVMLRLYPLLFGILSLPAFYWLTYELFQSPAIALLATTMMALSPFQIVYAQDLREYSLYALVFSISCAAFLKAWRENTMDTWALYTCTAATSFCCSFWMLLVTASQFAYATGATIFRKSKNENDFHKLGILCTSGGLALGVVSLVISDLICNMQKARATMQWLELPIETTATNSAWLFGRLFGWMYHPSYGYIHGNSRIAEANNPVMVLILIVELWALCYMAKGERPQLAFLLLIALAFAAVLDLPEALFGGRRSLNVRYFLPVTLIAFLPVSNMLVQFWKSKSRPRQACAIAIFAFLTATQLCADYALKDCRERGSVLYQLEPIARILNEAPYDSLVIVDRQPCNLPNMVALGRLVHGAHPFAWFMDKIPDWFKEVDRAYLVLSEPGSEKRYITKGFTATVLAPDVILLSRTKVSPAEKKIDSTK
ncbi:MAG: glycosyltransferase family 39 protein [Candidatus Obscuribacterales bacterium]|nr:glycosyltransferase family 39 protein [Candidatus Obscuribacterales bacterium]